MTSKAPALLVLCVTAFLAFAPTEARAQTTAYEILPGSHIDR